MLAKLSNRLLRRTFSNLSLRIDGSNKAAHLTLTNARRRNPLSLETIKELHARLLEVYSAVQSHNLKILVLRGEGTVFSAGHDLIELRNTKRPEEIFNECIKTMMLLKGIPVITLCAVNNMATAAGFQLALTCDLILASKGASFGIPGMKRGLFPSTPLVQLERSLKSECLKRQIVIYGEMLSAEAAMACGLVNKVVQEDKFDEEISSYITRAGKLSGEVLAFGKGVLSKQRELDLASAYDLAIEGMVRNLEKKDCRLGLQAFAQKRRPSFTN